MRTRVVGNPFPWAIKCGTLSVYQLIPFIPSYVERKILLKLLVWPQRLPKLSKLEVRFAQTEFPVSVSYGFLAFVGTGTGRAYAAAAAAAS